MVYTRYIKKRGKTFGPYYYESYRDGRNTRTRFLGGPKSEYAKKHYIVTKNKVRKNIFFISLLIGLLAFLFIGAIVYSPDKNEQVNIGYSVSNIGSKLYSYVTGFISDSIPKKDLRDSSGSLDNYKNQNSVNSGEGSSKKIVDVVSGSSSSPIINSGENNMDDNTENGGSKDTGNTIGDSKNKDSVGGGLVDDLKQGLDNKDNSKSTSNDKSLDSITTNGSEKDLESEISNKSKGGGVNLDETKNGENGSVSVEIPKLNNSWNSNSSEVNESIDNITTGNNDGNISSGNNSSTSLDKNATLGNESIIKDIQNTTIPKLITNNTSVKHARIIINRPVKWIERVNISNSGNNSQTISIPIDADNISILSGKEIDLAEQEIDDYNQTIEESDREKLVDGTITGLVSFDINSKNGFIKKGWLWIVNLFKNFGITGNAVSGKNASINITTTDVEKIIDVSKISNQKNSVDVAIEYYTNGPTSVEEDFGRKKRITISAPNELGYKNVLSYTKILEIYSVGEEDRIKIYWKENKSFINFTAMDIDGNGKLDYVEWNVEHLSNQTYDIILVTKAEHLDMNKLFVSDIFEQIRDLDGNWSESISDGEYVRVTFEHPLYDGRDITIWPKTINGTPSIEVYEFGGNETVGIFESLIDEKYNKIYLNGVNGEQYSFDLKIIGGTVKFDHIIDPTIETFNTTAGDGHVYKDGKCTTWSCAREATTGTSASATGTTATIQSAEGFGTNDYKVYRGFIPINSSGIPDDAVISNATVHVYVSGRANGDNDGDDFIVIVGNTTQASFTTLATSDFDNDGAVNSSHEFSDRLDITSISTGTWVTFTLNSEGIASINLTGISPFGIREGHDVLNNIIATNKANRIIMHTSEGTNKPYLNVTYTALTADGGVCSAGSDCTNNLCISGVCRAAGSCSTNAGGGCSEDSNNWDSASGGACLTDGSCNTTGPISMNCFSTCEIGDTTTATCGSTGYACDTTAGGGNFSQNGMCADSSCVTTSDVVFLSGQYHSQCDGYGGSVCDDVITSGADFSATGMCFDDGGATDSVNFDCETSGYIFYNGTIYDDDTAVTNETYDASFDMTGKSCDRTLSGGAVYKADGMVTLSGCTPTGTEVYIDVCNEAYFTTGGCDSGQNLCDTNITSDLTAPFVSEGRCISNTCQTTASAVYYDDEAACASKYTNTSVSSSKDHDTDSSGDSCDSSRTGTGGYTADGMIVNSGGDLLTDCDTFGGVVRVDASAGNVYVANCDNSSADECDSSTANSADPYLSEGICISGSVCDVDETCFDDTLYQADCSSCSSSDTDVDSCDSDVGASGYIANGYCTTGGVCSFGAVYDNGGTLTDGCTNGGGELCDSDATGSESGVWSDDAEGVCVVGSICDVDEVAKNCNYAGADCSTYYRDCSSVQTNDRCDTDATSSGYSENGFCAGATCTVCSVDESATCGDGYDNDCDGFVDSADSDCGDIIPPIVTINFPANVTYGYADLPLNFNVSLNENGSVKYSLDGGINNVTMYNSSGGVVGLEFNHTNGSIPDGSYVFQVYANDTSGNNNNSANVTFSLDATFPSVSGLTEAPSDPTTYVAGKTYEFNSTITDNNLQTVYVEFDGTNYTPTNYIGNVYNFSISDLPVGVYNYYWYANDSGGNVNDTESGTYTISSAAGDVTLLINGSASNQTGTYGIQTNVSTTTSYGSVTLYRDGVDVSSEDSSFVTLGGGNYNYTAVSSGDQNHSSATLTRWVHINRANSEVNLTLNNSKSNMTLEIVNSTELNGTLVTGDSQSIIRLYNNGTLINEGTSPIGNLTTFNNEGLYNITLTYPQTQNYTASSETYYVNATNTSVSITMSLSPKLANQINWSVDTTPIYNFSAEGNNGTNITLYFINLTCAGGNCDVYMKANSDLLTPDADVLGIRNETFSYNLTNSSVPSDEKFSLTTSYTDNKIGDSLTGNNIIYLKFFINVPIAQPAGNYNNSLIFKVVKSGQSP